LIQVKVNPVARLCSRSFLRRLVGSGHNPASWEDTSRESVMLYAVLCYHEEDVVSSWSRQEEQAVMGRLSVIQDRVAKSGKMGPSLRLLPTTAATTLRNTQDPPLVIDGPFAETKEQLLGFYVIEAADLEEALAVTREIAAANPGGTYEVRPVALYNPDRRVAVDP
jgi:hypothetical protein